MYSTNGNSDSFKEEALTKAKKIAAVDYEINGSYANAPYDVRVQGTMLKARVRTIELRAEPGGEPNCRFDLEIVQPETVVATHGLENKAKNTVKVSPESKL